MAVRNQNWYNLQSTRRYPLDDKSTGEDDAGATIRDDILVDCHIRFPEDLGNYLYIQGLTVSPTLVTVLFGVAESLTSSAATTIAAVTVVKPVDIGVNYAVQALQPGVSGWVAFGGGVDTPFSGRYSTPAQSFVNPRNARPYAPLPIPTIGRIGLDSALSGIVNIAADAPMVATYYDNYTVPKYDPETDTVNSEPVKAVVLSCVAPTAGFNPYTFFLGPCGQRPESGTCNKTPIETINGVEPDCETGNINIFVAGGMSARPFIACGGIDITTPLSLAAACDDVPPGSKQRRDICCPDEPDGESEFCWPQPTPVEAPVQQMQTYPTLPVRVTFDTGAQDFDVKAGIFSHGTADDVPTYLAQSPTNLSLAVYRRCPSDWAVQRTVSTTFKVDKAGQRRTAGVVLNYNSVRDGGKQKATYVLALYDADASQLQIHRYNGDLLIQETQTTVITQPKRWHTLAARAEFDNNGGAIITADLYDAKDEQHIVRLQTTIAEYDIIDGRCGIAALASSTHFSEFTIQ